MAYATLDNVRALLSKFTIDANSAPSATEATTLIDQIDGEINTVLASVGVTVPVAAPAHFVSALAILNTYGAAVLVAQAMFPDRAGAAEGSAALYTVWDQRYRTGLAKLRDGSGIPPSVAVGGRVHPSTYFTRNPDAEEDLGDIAEPTFTRTMIF